VLNEKWIKENGVKKMFNLVKLENKIFVDFFSANHISLLPIGNKV